MKREAEGLLAYSKENLSRLQQNNKEYNEWLRANRDKIALIAYYKAEARKFEPGGEEQDWFEAEEEVARALIPHEFFV
ncbi:MAG: DUF2934 domain-containing protein [Gammaproteobacteria bacterium]|nr:DUF2934 domain-containing protein [Gammaproteobacteria bacterium]MBU1724683.1 DUF2934 domain-containing protein [Gammaproteobacteria bacterium]MBU2005857.1 DUF2934 domain-containing protein [Gammaproteobacteria bacterium]